MAIWDDINKLNQSIEGFGSSVGGFFTEALQGTARSATGLGLSIGNIFTSPFGVKTKEIPTSNKFLKAVYGEESVKSLGYRAELERAREQNEGIIAGFRVPDSISKFTAPTLVLAGTALDLTGFGGATKKEPIKVASEYLAKTDKLDKVVSSLKKMGVQDDLLKPYGEVITKSTDANEIEKALLSIDKIQRGTTTTSKKLIEDIAKPIYLGSKSNDLVKSKVTSFADDIYKKYDLEIKEPIVMSAKKSAREEAKFIKSVGKAKQTEAFEAKLTKQSAKYDNKIAKLAQKNIDEVVRRKDEIAKLREQKNEQITKLELNLTEQRKNAIRKLKDRAASLSEKRNAIYQYSKGMPKEIRGLVNRDISKATTNGQVIEAFRKLDTAYTTAFKKTTISKIEDIVKKSDELPYSYQERIMAEVIPYRTKNFSEETIDKITKLKNFIETSPETVNKLGKGNLKKYTLADDLSKPNLFDNDKISLYNTYNKIKKTYEEGKLYNKHKEATLKLEKENAVSEIIKTANKLTDTIERKAGTILDKTSEAAKKKSDIKNPIKILNINKSSSDVVFEMIDGKRNGAMYNLFKKKFDDAYYNFKEMSSSVKSDYHEFKKALEDTYGKFDNSNFERIMIYATKNQVGGYEKLEKSGFLKDYADSIVLSQKEAQLYYKMRMLLEDIHPLVARTYEEMSSKRLGYIENYFPLQNDFDNADEVAVRLGNEYNNIARTTKGFTKTRVGGKEKLRINAEDIFLKYVDDSTYYASTERQIKFMDSISRDTRFREAVGADAAKWTNDWVKLQARKGIPEGYKPTIVTELIRRIGSSMLGFNLSPVLKQPLAKITSGSLMGTDAFRYDKEFLVDNIQQFVQKASKQQKLRTVDDPAFEEFSRSKKLSDLQIQGYSWIKKVDQLTSDNVWYNAYRKYYNDNNLEFSLDGFKSGKYNNKALEYADYIVRRTQGTGDKKDAPMLLANTSSDLVRAALQFQRFIINESDLITHDLPKSLLKDKDPLAAITILSFWTAAGLAEDMVSSGYSSLFTGDKEEDEKKFSSVLFDTYAGRIPGVNNFYSMYKYGSSGVPLFDITRDLAVGTGRMLTGKKDETKQRGAIDAGAAALSLSGVPGVSQAKKIIKSTVNDDSSSDKAKINKKIKKKIKKKE